WSGGGPGPGDPQVDGRGGPGGGPDDHVVVAEHQLPAVPGLLHAVAARGQPQQPVRQQLGDLADLVRPGPHHEQEQQHHEASRPDQPVPAPPGYQLAGAGPPPGPGHHEDQTGHDRPDPVVGPRDRRDQQAGDRAQHDPEQFEPAPAGQRGHDQPGHGHDQPRDQPDRVAGGVTGQHPVQDPVDRLVLQGEAALAGEVAEPEIMRGGRQHGEPDHTGHRERAQRHQPGPDPPRPEQERDEDQRGQLDPGRDADSDALPPAGIGQREIDDAQGQQDQVDL